MGNENDLQHVLAELGNTSEEVAAALETAGIQGVKNTVRYLNPIVRYVQAKLRLDDFGLDLMQRDGRRVHTLQLSLPSGPSQEAELPAPVREFLEAFNRGEHPGLELSNESL